MIADMAFDDEDAAADGIAFDDEDADAVAAEMNGELGDMPSADIHTKESTRTDQYHDAPKDWEDGAYSPVLQDLYRLWILTVLPQLMEIPTIHGGWFILSILGFRGKRQKMIQTSCY